MTRSLLVTNDFPPKVGGIQTYLGELWSRLDPSTTSVLTASSHGDAADHDARLGAAGLRVERVRRGTLYLPTSSARRAVAGAVARERPDVVLFDPCVPLGVLGVRGAVPYGLVLHGAELTFAARLPGLRRLTRAVLEGAAVVVAAGTYPEDEARRLAGARLPPVVVVPPGVDTTRFVPLDDAARRDARARLSLPVDAPLVVSVGRLVPRKGNDVLIEAVARCAASVRDVTLAIAGGGRDEARLRRLASRTRAPVRFLGRVSEEDKARLLGAADVFAQPCRSRWAGLEQEGFGIVFVEAAACGVPQVAGRSGGSADAVIHGTTGLVVDDPRSARDVAGALMALLADAPRRAAMGAAARRRAVASFEYELLARVLHEGLETVLPGPRAPGS